MFNRLGNALRTLLQPGWDDRLAADRKQVRELIAEMEDVMERFSRVVAREGMRRTRRMKAELRERDGEASEPPPTPPTPPTPEDDVAARKAALRKRIGIRRPDAAPLEQLQAVVERVRAEGQ